MNKSLFSFAAASVLLAGIGFASAQFATTTTWTTEQGRVFTDYPTTQKYSSFSDPALNPTVGSALPQTVTVYPLPSTVTVVQPDRYSYGIVNNQPVVVERTTRKVVPI